MGKVYKQRKKELTQQFWNEVYPDLEKSLDVVKFEHFAKVQLPSTDYDYYPGTEKLNKRTQLPNGEWVNNWQSLALGKVKEFFGV
jgi:hypothetical protein